MSNTNDFIIEDGILKVYRGAGGDIVIPDEVTGFLFVFAEFWEPFTLTLSKNMKANYDTLLSPGIVTVNIPVGTELECSSFGPNHSSSFTQLKEINVDPENQSCASENGILYSKDMTILYACPAAYEGEVVIPETVKEIGKRAFDGCKNLTEIIIPSTVEEIGERAFMDCKSLKKVVIQGDKTKIGKEAFLRCGKITTAGLYGSVKGKKGYSFEFPWTSSIPENAFSGMNKLKTVVLPDTVKSIGKNAFKGCKSLESINLPENVKCDKKTFKDCKKLSV